MTRLNCEAVVTLAHAFLANARPGDALINVSSTLAFAPTPELSGYSATKAFVTSFSEFLWHEQKKRGVYVMGLVPGADRPGTPRRARRQPRTPDQVVGAALAALRGRSRPTVVTGAANALFAAATRLISRKTVVRMSGAK